MAAQHGAKQISVADAGLVRVSLRALLATAQELAGQPEEA